MTGVMSFDEGMHGFKWQVVTGFTLGFWRGNINLGHERRSTNGGFIK